MIAAPTLSGQQQALLKALNERDPQLGAMYLGAIVVLASGGNPDRLPQCAHSLRELMEKLPELLDVPTKAQNESLKAKVRELEDVYTSAIKATACFSASHGWDGPIDGGLRGLLARLDRFFSWFASHHPRRIDELREMLARLDGSGRALPPPLAAMNVGAWNELRDFFQSVAHHRRVVAAEELSQWLDALERFLLDRLRPRTFEDLADIDALLEEGGSDA